MHFRFWSRVRERIPGFPHARRTSPEGAGSAVPPAGSEERLEQVLLTGLRSLREECARQPAADPDAVWRRVAPRLSEAPVRAPASRRAGRLVLAGAAAIACTAVVTWHSRTAVVRVDPGSLAWVRESRRSGRRGQRSAGRQHRPPLVGAGPGAGRGDETMKQAFAPFLALALLLGSAPVWAQGKPDRLKLPGGKTSAARDDADAETTPGPGWAEAGLASGEPEAEGADRAAPERAGRALPGVRPEAGPDPGTAPEDQPGPGTPPSEPPGSAEAAADHPLHGAVRPTPGLPPG